MLEMCIRVAYASGVRWLVLKVGPSAFFVDGIWSKFVRSAWIVMLLFGGLVNVTLMLTLV